MFSNCQQNNEYSLYLEKQWLTCPGLMAIPTPPLGTIHKLCSYLGNLLINPIYIFVKKKGSVYLNK